MHINIELFNKERSIVGFAYELIRMCEKYDEEKNPIIEEFHTFTIGLLVLNIQVSFKS